MALFFRVHPSNEPFNNDQKDGIIAVEQAGEVSTSSTRRGSGARPNVLGETYYAINEVIIH